MTCWLERCKQRSGKVINDKPDCGEEGLIGDTQELFLTRSEVYRNQEQSHIFRVLPPPSQHKS